MTGPILLETRPAMIIRSLCRGDPRKTSAPNREMSKRDALMDIISIAQQASPNDIGQIEFLRPQLMTLSSVVITAPDCSSACSIVSLSMCENSSLGPLAIGGVITSLWHAKSSDRCDQAAQQRDPVGDSR